MHCIPGEPTLSDITEGVQAANGREVVVAIGGGSAIDAGKAIAALATNPGEPLDYLEVIGRGQPLTETPLPFIAIPTTGGTGAEVLLTQVETNDNTGNPTNNNARGASSVRAADFNGDGVDDLVVGGRYGTLLYFDGASPAPKKWGGRKAPPVPE